MFDLALRGGTIVTSTGVVTADIGISDGRIAALAQPGSLGPATAEISAAGLHVFPGLIDPHVHLRDLGESNKEDFGSGTRAAAAGGVTTVMAIPNTKPPLVTPAALETAVAAASAKAVVDVAIFAGARFGDPEGIDAFVGTDAIAYDLGDDPYEFSTARWIDIMQRVKQSGLPICFYINDKTLRALNQKELLAQGALPHEAWVGSSPGSLEVRCIGQIVPFAARFDIPIVLRAVTTPQGLELIRQMRRLFPKAQITVETCVHYLYLTMDDLADKGAAAFMGPPLRPATDLPALWAAVQDGTINYIGTDHAPHTPQEKDKPEFLTTPPGIVGLETLLPLMLKAHADGQISLSDIARLCSETPARTFGLFPRKGSMAIGADADLVLVDLNARWKIDSSKFYTRGDSGPFHGWEIAGRPVRTLVRGRTVMHDGVVEPTATGQVLRPADREKRG